LPLGLELECFGRLPLGSALDGFGSLPLGLELSSTASAAGPSARRQ
jgi:hypothetical protein